MDNANARLDYFRSEFEGKLERVKQDAKETEKRLLARIDSLEKLLNAQGRELHDIRLHV